MSDRVEDSIENAILKKMDEELVEGADDVMSSLRVDHHRMTETWNRAVAFAVQTSPVQQFGIGFGVGWLSGYLFRKVSRTAAFAVGCTFLALQGAVATGIINVNWSRLRRAAEHRLSRVRSITSTTQNEHIFDQLITFVHRHVYISSGFAAGAVVGITF